MDEKDRRIALESELMSKDEWIERLLEFTELTPEQVKESCECNNLAAGMAELMKRIPFDIFGIRQ